MTRPHFYLGSDNQHHNLVAAVLIPLLALTAVLTSVLAAFLIAALTLLLMLTLMKVLMLNAH